MTKLTKTTLLNTTKPRAETLMDKTTRVVREILDEETAQRQIRTLRLRKARLEREAVAPVEKITSTPGGAPKKARAKAAN